MKEWLRKPWHSDPVYYTTYLLFMTSSFYEVFVNFLSISRVSCHGELLPYFQDGQGSWCHSFRFWFCFWMYGVVYPTNLWALLLWKYKHCCSHTYKEWKVTKNILTLENSTITNYSPECILCPLLFILLYPPITETLKYMTGFLSLFSPVFLWSPGESDSLFKTMKIWQFFK